MQRIFSPLRSSVLHTLVAGLLLITFPTLMLGYLYQSESIRVASDEISSSYENAVTLLAKQFTDRLNSITRQASALLLDDDLIHISHQTESELDLLDLVTFQRKATLYRATNFVDNDLTIFFPRQNWMISTQHGAEHLPSSLQPAVNAGQWSIRPTLRNGNELCLASYCGYIHEAQTSPFALLEISQSEMERMLAGIMENTHTYCAFFSDGDGNLFHYGEPLDNALQTCISDYIMQSSVQSRRIQWNDQTLVLYSYPIAGANCTIGILLNESELYLPQQKMRTIYSVFIFCSVLGCVLFLVFPYRRIFKPVKALLEGMEKVETGCLSTAVYESGPYEFRVIARKFNRMMQRLDTLIKQDFVNQLKLKNAQLRYLRSQINPHFLHNCLFSLYNMIEADDLDSASEMALYLGKYYQRSAHMDEHDLTLEEEIQNIQVYARVMSLRFPDRLRLEMQIQPETKQLRIPVLSLQTVVENALMHGMEGTSNVCIVTISSALQGEELKLRVADTGAGMSEEKIQEIMENLQQAANVDERHGLENVFIRLKLMYGDQVRMTVQKNNPRGVLVEIFIPLQAPQILSTPPRKPTVS